MATVGPLNKTGPTTQFQMWVDVLSTDIPNNRTLLRGTLRNVQTGSPAGSTNPSRWLNAGRMEGWFGGYNFGTHHGNPFLPAAGSGAWRWNDIFDFWIYHDANGYYNGGNPMQISFRVVYAVDETHYGSITIARIPKVPGQTSPVAVDENTTTSLRYRFSGGTNGGSAITAWETQYSTSPTFASGNSGIINSSGTHTYTGLTPGTTYYFRSRGVNSVGAGPWSSVMSGTTLPAVAPGMLVVPTLPGFGANVTLSPPGGVSGVTEYNVEYRPTVGGVPVTALTSAGISVDVTGLTPGVSYDWRANAEIGTYTSPWTAWTPYVQPNPNTDPGKYFDGNSADTPEVTYDWTGTADLSTSTASSPAPAGWWTFAMGVGASGATGVVSQVLDSAPVAAGTHAARVVFKTNASAAGFKAGTQGVAVEELANYVGSMYAKPSRAQRLVARIEFYTAASVFIIGYDGTPAEVAAGVWTRLNVSAQAPPTAEYAAIVVMDVAGAGWSTWKSGDTLTLDAAMVSLAAQFPYFDGDTPPTVEYDYEWLGLANGSESRRLVLAASATDPLADPDCPPAPTPPSPPVIPSECITEIGVWRRYMLQVPAIEVGLWASTIPTLTMNTGADPERQVRVRYYPNPDGVAPELIDTSAWEAELILTYIPPNTELTMDGVTQRVWASVNGGAVIPANQLLYGTNGVPATWPELRCGIGYVITLDVPLDAPAGNLETSLLLTPRM